MCDNRKREDQIEAKTEAIDLPAHADARQDREKSICPEEKQKLRERAEDLVQKPEDIVPETLTSSDQGENEISSSSRCKYKILVVDDNENIRDMLDDFLTFEGHKPVLAKDGKEALKLFSEQDFDMVITDLGMPGMSGWELSKQIKQRKPQIPIVIITGWGAQLGAEDLKKNEVELLLSKPFSLDQVKQVIESVGAKHLSQER